MARAVSQKRRLPSIVSVCIRDVRHAHGHGCGRFTLRAHSVLVAPAITHHLHLQLRRPPPHAAAAA
jgi:hypothetical protein